jgi:uncharacterized membrane protein required for colicin V production
MTLIDLCLLVALGGFVLAGFWFGLVHMVGSFAGLIIGIIVAGQFEGVVAEKIVGFTAGNMNLAHIVAFVLIFTVVTRLAGIALWLVEKVIGIFHVIPFLKTFDRLLGAALGFLEGAIAIGLTVYFASRFPINFGFAEMLKDSVFAPRFDAVGTAFAALLPAAIRALKSVI